MKKQSLLFFCFLVIFFLPLRGEENSPPPDSSPPRVSCIYSPKRTVYLQAGHVNRFLRIPETLPTGPFTLFTQVNDLVEVQFDDGSVIRQGPQTLMEYLPSLRQVSIAGGSILGHFSKEALLKINNPDVQGRDCAFMISVSNKGIKAFSLSGKLEFRGQRIEEGQMFYYNGRPKLDGPYLIDLAELIRSSPLTVEFPGSKWVREITQKPIEHQKWKKDLGLVEPSNTMLEGADNAAKRTDQPSK